MWESTRQQRWKNIGYTAMAMGMSWVGGLAGLIILALIMEPRQALTTEQVIALTDGWVSPFQWLALYGLLAAAAAPVLHYLKRPVIYLGLYGSLITLQVLIAYLLTPSWPFAILATTASVMLSSPFIVISRPSSNWR